MSLPTVSVIRPQAESENNSRSLDRALEISSTQLSASILGVALGTDENGSPVVLDLAEAPHLLIAGTTGSGKSVCSHVILANLLLRNSPADLRLLLIDTKRLEMLAYNGIPHLRHPVITNPREAVSVLKWAACEIADRAEQFAIHYSRSLAEFNKQGCARANFAPLPRLVIIADDLGDITTAEPETGHVCELIAQQGRSVGVHLVAITQRPTAVTVPAPLKSLFASRLAFRLPSVADSRSILDRAGAERLPGVGASILITPHLSHGIAVENAFIGYSEVDELANWWRMQAVAADSDLPISDQSMGAVGINTRDGEDEVSEVEADKERDKLFHEAAQIVMQNQRGSTSLLQRRLKIGYGRAARIMEQLQLAGVLSASDGPRGRDVLLTLDDLDGLLDVTFRVRTPGNKPPAVSLAHAAPSTLEGKARSHSPVPVPAPRLPLIDRILRRLGG